MNIDSNEELGKSQNNIVNHERCVEVPRGWNRCLENGNIVYFSPSQICLRSKEDIARYLISDRTCKCGLDCPLYIDKVFNFDASIPSHHFKITKLDNDHKTLCKETIKARFATLAQTQTVVKKETKGVVSKPVIIKKKSEVHVSVSKKKNETPKLPSFETFASLADGIPNQNLQDQLKPKKARKPSSQKRKSNANAALTSSVPVPGPSTAMQICQTVHSNTTPILHSTVEMQKSASKDAMPQAPQYPSLSTGSIFGSSEYHSLNQNVGSLFTFPSTHLNASTFLASLSSSTPTIPVRTQSARSAELSLTQKVHPSLPFSAKSPVENLPLGPKPVTATFPVAPNQPNNVVYLSSGLHSIPNQNSKVNWQGSSGISLSRLPQGKVSADKISLDKPKGGFSLPKIVYPYPTQVPTAKSTMSCSTASSVTPFSKLEMKQHDLQQVLQKQQTSATVKTSIAGRSETVLPTPGYPSTFLSNTDNVNARAIGGAKSGEAINQPVQYCGILLQPGMVPQVQLAGAGVRPTSASACNNQGAEQNQYGGLYTLQGIPYGSNVGAVGNPAVLGMTPNTIFPYFLGITQPATIPKPIVPATTSTSTTKESSPTSGSVSTAPVSTSAISAAYSAFVSIAPASATNASFSQQLVNLVSNYSGSYWQHLLAQGANPNTLSAYQLMINQTASTRPGFSNHTTKSSPVKNAVSSRGQTKVTSSSSKSPRFGLQECKPKVSAKDSLPVPTTSSAVTTTTVTTVSEGDQRRTTDCATSRSCTSNTIVASVCTSTGSESVTSTKNSSTENTSDKPCENSADDTNVILTVTQNSSEEICDDHTKICEENTKICDENTKICDENTNNTALAHHVSDETLTQEVTQDNLESTTVKADLNTIEKDEQGNDEEVNSQAFGNENIVASEHDSTMPKCEEVETDNGNNECKIVTSDSKNEEDLSINNTCINFDKENDSIVSEEGKESCCIVKTESLEDTSQTETPMETSSSNHSSSNLFNNQNCDQDSQVKDEEVIEKRIDNDIQNGITETMSNADTKIAEDARISEKETPECNVPAEFTIGDVVWAQARGLPSWPGKIVDESFAGSGKADNGKKWVMWFGDHTYSQVEVEKLKTLTDGLKTLDDKGRKRKYRGKKSRAGLEQAIGEALEELDQRERLRSRQGPKAKKRRL